MREISIENWKNNRPPDENRIPEITRQLQKTSYVDGIIYLAYDEKLQKYYCYDGIHRVHSLMFLYSKADNGYEYNHFVTLHIIPYIENEIRVKFENINKCIPVPQLYVVKEYEKDMKEMIIKVTKYFTNKYKLHFTHSSHPNIPNENRDVFTNKITAFIEKYENEIGEKYSKYDKESDKALIEELELFNTYRKENEIRRFKKLTAKQREKCSKSGCYLFITKDWETMFWNYTSQNNTIIL
jgi:hypothetical protein